MQHIGGSTLPDKWHILVCHMEAASVVRAHPDRWSIPAPSLQRVSGWLLMVAVWGFFIIGGCDTAIMCSTSSAGLFPEYGLHGFGPSILIDRYTTLECGKKTAT